MKALAITHKGIEDITFLEIKELVKAKNLKQEESCVSFEIKSMEDLALLNYKAQSVYKIIYLFDSFKIKKLEDIENSIQRNIDEIRKFINNKTTFAVRCLKIDNDNFSSNEIEEETGNFITIKAKVDLENPDVIFFVYICKNNCCIGIDFSRKDLSKRDYRIYAHPQALKGTIAYSLVRIADYKPNEKIIDPFCGSGTIPIEAALFATGFSVNHYTKDKFKFKNFEKFDKNKTVKTGISGFDRELRHVMASKKNAQIAGIEKNIRFSRIDIELLDTKIKEKSIDKIITNPPDLTNNTNPKQLEKLYNEFFCNAGFILKNKGTITLITKTFELIKKAAEKYKFKLMKERDLIIGDDNYKVVVFEK